MKSFKQLREELSPELLATFKSPIDKRKEFAKDTGGVHVHVDDPENNGKNDLIYRKIPAHEIVFNTKEKGEKKK